MGRPPLDLVAREREVVLPHPAEDLSEDDDLLSWILVDQLGCLPQTKLGVHPQQVKFIGPSFKTEDVLSIVRDTIIKGNMQAAMEKLLEFHLIKDHLASKQTDGQRKRTTQHLKRYLTIYLPTSKIEIHTTARYSHITGHPELAVFATRALPPGLVLSELQGGVVPLPDAWREEMDIGDAFMENEEDRDDDADNEDAEDDEGGPSDRGRSRSASAVVRKDKGKEREADIRGQRRSGRTKRRDFSIIWSGLKRSYQLFLGPARFLNHDCSPNVELYREGKYVTFRVLRPIRIGDELTTYYGENYFGKENIECLCLTCEQNHKGGFTPKLRLERSLSRSNTASRSGSPFVRDTRPPMSSSLRNVLNTEEVDSMSNDEGAESNSVSQSAQEDGDTYETGSVAPDDDDGSRSVATLATPTKARFSGDAPSPGSSGAQSDAGSPDAVVRRERHFRKVRGKAKPIQWLSRPRKRNQIVIDEQASTPAQTDMTEGSDLTDGYPEEFPRCATCVKPLTEQVWYLGRYFDHCSRCIRHSLIFETAWPARESRNVLEYPPSHLIPANFIPRRISTVPLPTLNKVPKPIKNASATELEETIATVGVPMDEGTPDTKEERLRRRETNVYEYEQFMHETLREEAWHAQLAIEELEAKKVAAREEAKKQREEEKRKRNEGKVRGSGVWSRYAIITEEEFQRQQMEKNMVRSGTRRGGRFRNDAEEEEMRKRAQEALDAQRRAAEQARAKKEEDDDEDDEDTEDVVGGIDVDVDMASDSHSTARARAKTPAAARTATRGAALSSSSRPTASTSRIHVPPPSALPPKVMGLVEDVIDVTQLDSSDDDDLERESLRANKEKSDSFMDLLQFRTTPKDSAPRRSSYHSKSGSRSPTKRSRPLDTPTARGTREDAIEVSSDDNEQLVGSAGKVPFNGFHRTARDDDDDESDDLKQISVKEMLAIARSSPSKSFPVHPSPDRTWLPALAATTLPTTSVVAGPSSLNGSGERVKRGRGRPPGTGHLQKQAAKRQLASSASDSSLSSTAKRGRGRPPSRPSSISQAGQVGISPPVRAAQPSTTESSRDKGKASTQFPSPIAISPSSSTGPKRLGPLGSFSRSRPASFHPTQPTQIGSNTLNTGSIFRFPHPLALHPSAAVGGSSGSARTSASTSASTASSSLDEASPPEMIDMVSVPSTGSLDDVDVIAGSSFARRLGGPLKKTVNDLLLPVPSHSNSSSSNNNNNGNGSSHISNLINHNNNGNSSSGNSNSGLRHLFGNVFQKSLPSLDQFDRTSSTGGHTHLRPFGETALGRNWKTN